MRMRKSNSNRSANSSRATGIPVFGRVFLSNIAVKQPHIFPTFIIVSRRLDGCFVCWNGIHVFGGIVQERVLGLPYVNSRMLLSLHKRQLSHLLDGRSQKK